MKVSGTENCFGEKLARVMVKPDSDFFTQDAWVMADELIFIFEKSRLRVKTVQDSDVLQVVFCEEATDGEKLDGFAELKALEKYIGQELVMTWSGTNSSSYSDSLMVGFDNIHPNLIILSEGSVLKLFDVNQMMH